MKFFGAIGTLELLHFGVDPDPDPDPGIFLQDSLFTLVIPVDSQA